MINYIELDFAIKAETDNGLISYIPKDEANSDYQRYLRWLENPNAEEGGTSNSVR